MSDWSHGYNVSQGYTYGSFKELSPAWLDAATLFNGYLPPEHEGGHFRYLELGCGQGFGLCLLAAAYPDAEFVGIDFNPEHIAHGRQLARAAQLGNIRFLEADFATLAADWPRDLGQFHYVTLHGIIAWVTPAIRQAIVRCLNGATLPGALVYVSYNTVPGWLSTIPFQHVLSRMAQNSGKPGAQVIAEGIALFDGLRENGALINTTLPMLANRVQTARTQAEPYLVQEYLHDDWHPLWFSAVAAELAEAKLSYIGSAVLADALLPTALPQGLREVVTGVADPLLRQDVTDCAISLAFRRDIFCRGPVRSATRAEDPVERLRLKLVDRPRSPDAKIATNFGSVALTPAVAGSVLDLAARGGCTVADAMAQPELASQRTEGAAPVILLLLHGGNLVVERDDDASVDAAQRLNDVIVAAAAGGAPYADLLLPRLGWAMKIGDVDMIMLAAWRRTPGLAADPAGLAAALVEGLARRGRKLLVEGKPVPDDAEAPLSLAVARDFLGRKLPFWTGLGAFSPAE